MIPLLLLFFQQPWGTTHAGKPVPQFTDGEECLFCHRNEIGAAWQMNAHGITVNEKAGTEEFTLGSRNHVRRLKKAGYNKFAIWESGWNETKFGDRCAGCHTTAVDPATKSFAYYGLDCYTCHGVVDLKHSGDTTLVLLSKKRRNEDPVINAICASCHLRGSLSKSTKLPYPNNFVPGDNLFLDLQVDWAQADNADLNPGDRHVYRSARDVEQKGSTTTCINCHSVHTGSSERHRRVLSSAICNDCHFEGQPRKEVRKYTVRSIICEYP
ncbi:MAG: hypothetical protein FJW20_02850 [Acidimicrobiia bacterium]|nr:hypothetical protein [Acidimicrobiia bacterium]